MNAAEQSALRRELAARGLSELPVLCPETVDSTNSLCAKTLGPGTERCLVIADRQTAGRGRSGHSFYSPPEAGLYLSLGFPMRIGAEGPAGLTTLAAVAAAEEIERLSGKRCGIKWVNDLFLEGKKVCGILTEATGGFVIVGVGVNLSPSAVPEELRGIMGWIGAPEIRPALAAGIAARLLAHRPGSTAHMTAYRQRSLVLGRMVRFTWEGQPREALGVAIEDDGALLLRDARQQEYCLRFGEVSVKL